MGEESRVKASARPTFMLLPIMGDPVKQEKRGEKRGGKIKEFVGTIKIVKKVKEKKGEGVKQGP